MKFGLARGTVGPKRNAPQCRCVPHNYGLHLPWHCIPGHRGVNPTINQLSNATDIII
jgi:hypothetical protein